MYCQNYLSNKNAIDKIKVLMIYKIIQIFRKYIDVYIFNRMYVEYYPHGNSKINVKHETFRFEEAYKKKIKKVMTNDITVKENIYFLNNINSEYNSKNFKIKIISDLGCGNEQLFTDLGLDIIERDYTTQSIKVEGCLEPAIMVQYLLQNNIHE